MAGIAGAGFSGATAGARAGILQGLQWEPEFADREAVAEAAVDSPDSRVEARVVIRETDDIVNARRAGYLLAKTLGFSDSRITMVTTAISELARNILLYAGSGEIVLSRLNASLPGVVVVTAIDRGPGIANLESAMAGGFSTSGGLGLGLSGLNHIMDTFTIQSQPGEGTQVVVGVSS